MTHTTPPCPVATLPITAQLRTGLPSSCSASANGSARSVTPRVHSRQRVEQNRTRTIGSDILRKLAVTDGFEIADAWIATTALMAFASSSGCSVEAPDSWSPPASDGTAGAQAMPGGSINSSALGGATGGPPLSFGIMDSGPAFKIVRE
ncbi:MAG TPA: hypothetical protein VKP30_13090 [Polyangiaceae bacterium]|nr:hypothetical protein [Polyangiaceae bacterium]